VKNNFRLLVLTTALLLSKAVTAQRAEEVSGYNFRKNTVKINVSSLLLKNASLQYERVLKGNTALALGVSIIPKTGLPFANWLKNELSNNPDVNRAIDNTKLSNFSITPEIRFYMGRKGDASGFYIAPFARYNHFNFEQLYDFTASTNRVYRPFITGSINTLSGGLLIGTKWNIGKSLSLDWWILGPSFGSINGLLVGNANFSDMSAADRQQLERDIEDVDLPLIKTDATVSANRIDVRLSGSSVGLRAFGLALGIPF
jgi:hypothetical protein